MMDFKGLITIGGALVLGAALSGNVLAVPLLPNETLTNPDEGLPAGTGGFFTTADSPTAIGGGLYGGVTNLLGNQTGAMTGAFTGSVESWVYGDDADNSTQLLFVYRFAMNQGEDDPDLIRATIGDARHPWAGFSIVDAGADQSGSSAAGGTEDDDEWSDGDPNFLLRDPVDQEGLTIQWRALGGGTTLQENDTSSLIWYLVNAEDFTTTDVGLLDSGSVGSATAFAPVEVDEPMPEPVPLALVALGMVGMGVARRRRKTA